MKNSVRPPAYAVARFNPSRKPPSGKQVTRMGTAEQPLTMAAGPLVTPPRRRWRWPTPKVLIIGATTVVIGYLALVPLYYLLWGTFFDEKGFTLNGFTAAYGDPRIGEMIGNSLLFAGGSAVLAL